MTYVYDKSGQKIFFVREATYGEPYDPEAAISAWTILAADYPHWRRFDLIPEGIDFVLPIIEKLKQFDVGDSKHASAILSGNIEPVDFSLEMTARGLEFLMLSVGSPTLSSHNQAMVQTITCVADASSSLNNKYFLIDAITSNITEHFAVWFDVNSAGSAPTITGINASNVLEVDLGVSDTATAVATAVAAKLDADATFGATSSGAVVTVTHAATGAVLPAHNSGSATTPGFSYSITTNGATIYTVSEALTTVLPSFTIHLEQENSDITTATEDIVWDAFGCVVESIEVISNFGDKVVKYSVTFKCPYALENTNGVATNPPPKKKLLGFPTMNTLKEGANAYLIQEESATPDTHTDRTPKTVDSVTLTIANNVTFKGDISKRYLNNAFSGKRDITLQIIGATQEKELFTYWQEKWKNVGDDWYPDSAAGRLNTKFTLTKTATYDTLTISIYQWLLREHNFHFVSVDEAVKSVDMTFEDGAGDSNGRAIDSFTMASYIDETVMIV